MKTRITALLLVLVMVFALAACGSSGQGSASGDGKKEEESKPATELLLGQGAEQKDKYAFTFDGADFGEQIVEKIGNSTSYLSTGSSYNFYIKLRYTNQANEPFPARDSDRFSDIKLKAGDKSYDGKVAVASGDIAPLSTAYVYLYFEVPQDLAGSGTPMTVTFKADGDKYKVVVVDDSGKSLVSPSNNTSATWITVGEQATAGEKSSFVIDELYYASKVSYTTGSITYTYGQDGKYYLIFKVSLTNNDKEAFDEYGGRITNVLLTYKDSYKYEGEVRAVPDDIQPLDTGLVYIYFEIPTAIENDIEPLIASFTVDGVPFLVDCRAS